VSRMAGGYSGGNPKKEAQKSKPKNSASRGKRESPKRNRLAMLAEGLADGLRSSAAVTAVRGPGDAAALEIHSEAEAVVREFLAIDNDSADRDFIFQRSDLCRFARLPGAAGNHAGAVSTDVIRTGQFCSVGRLILRVGEAHNNRDW